jgi:hypothetical protein
MKTSFAAALMSLALPAFAGTFHANIDYVMCGEIDPIVIGDACIVQLTKADGKELGLVFDFDDFNARFSENELTGARVTINDALLSKIYDAEVIRELNDYSRNFYMNAKIDALTVLSSGEMNDFVNLTNGNFYASRLPVGYRAVKLDKLTPKAGLKAFLENETKVKMEMWKEYVLTSGEFDHVTLAERKKIAANPLKEMQITSLLEMDEVYAIYKGNKLIGYFLDITDYVQASIYQDGAWIDLFIDANLNVVRSFDQSA